MGLINHGTQNINYSFFDELRQEDWARKDNHVTPRGIYHGGYLSRVSNTQLTLTPLKVELGDTDIQVSIDTLQDVTITDAILDSGTLSLTTPYIVLRYAYAYGPNNYMEIHAVATPLPNDAVVGKTQWATTTLLDEIDYTDRTEPNVLDYKLRVDAESTPGLYVRVHGGRVSTTVASVEVKNQILGPFTTPTSPNARIDIVYVDGNGIPMIQQGSSAVAPLAPNYAGKVVLAEVYVNAGVTAIYDADLTDVRAAFSRHTPATANAAGITYITKWDNIVIGANVGAQTNNYGTLVHGLGRAPDFVYGFLYQPSLGIQIPLSDIRNVSNNTGDISWDATQISWHEKGDKAASLSEYGLSERAIDTSWRIKIIAGFYAYSNYPVPQIPLGEDFHVLSYVKKFEGMQLWPTDVHPNRDHEQPGEISHGFGRRPDYVTVEVYHPGTGITANFHSLSGSYGVSGSYSWDAEKVIWNVIGYHFMTLNEHTGKPDPSDDRFFHTSDWCVRVICGFYTWEETTIPAPVSSLPPFWSVKTKNGVTYTTPAEFTAWDAEWSDISMGAIRYDTAGNVDTQSHLFTMNINNTSGSTIIKQYRRAWMDDNSYVFLDGVLQTWGPAEGSSMHDVDMSITSGAHTIQVVLNNAGGGSISHLLYGTLVDQSNTFFVAP